MPEAGFPVTGSSPHTRGARHQVFLSFGSNRIIPAYAGSTLAVGKIIHVSPDHPRIRGEHMLLPIVTKVTGGSSPHTRGALVWLLADEDAVGIIPAYAGSTPAASPNTSQASDHPRIRGEHDIITATGCRPWGSSPHTRGAHRRLGHPRQYPADHPRIRGEHHRLGCAGDFGRDHPRIRGEHLGFGYG